MPKLIRITTSPLSLKLLLSGQMKFMRENGLDVIMVSSDGKEVNQVKKNEGVQHVVIPFSRKITPLQDLKCLWKLFWLFKKERPDIVHTHTPKSGLLGMVAANLAGVKIRIHTLAGMPAMSAEKSKKRLLINAERWTYANASEVWPNSEGLLEYVMTHRLTPKSKLRLIGKGSSNGVDLKKFNRKSLQENHLIAATIRLMLEEDDFIILAVGRLVKDKGIEDLVQAFLNSRIVEKSKLVLLGSFEQELNPLSRKILEQIKSHPRIVQVAWTDHVAHYMALSDVLVHASHREGFPNVLLEAGAMYLPIICSDIIGNKDLITQQKTGLIFPVKEVSVLIEALEFAYYKRKKMLHYAENLYQEICEHFSREKIQQEILQTYQKLISTAKY